MEQNLSAMTLKLQKVTISAQKKDNLVNELKSYIEYIHNKYPKIIENEKQAFPLNFLIRHNSTESINSMASQRSYQSLEVTANKPSEENSAAKSSPKKRGWLRNSFSKAFNRKSNSQLKNQPNCDGGKKCLSDVDENDFGKQRMSEFDDYSLPNSPLHQQNQTNPKKNPVSSSPNTSNLSGQSANINSPSNQNLIGEEMEEFQRLLRDKEIKLTDIRLESLATAHQLDQTKEENLRMKIEIEQLRSENIRMQQFLATLQNDQHQFMVHNGHHHNHTQMPVSVCSSMSSPSPSSSVSSSSNNSKMNLSLSNSTQHVDIAMKFAEEKLKSPGSEFVGKTIVLNDPNINEGKRVLVAIHLGNTDPLLDPDEVINQRLLNSTTKNFILGLLIDIF